MLLAPLAPRNARPAWCDGDSSGSLLYKHFWDFIPARILTLFNTLCPDCDHITTIHIRVSSRAPGVKADVKPAHSWLSSVRRAQVFLWETINFGIYNPGTSYSKYSTAPQTIKQRHPGVCSPFKDHIGGFTCFNNKQCMPHITVKHFPE